MKYFFFLFTITLFLNSCQEESKIGFIDNSIVINEYQAKKDVEAKFKVKQELYNKKYDSIEASFQLEVQKFQVAARTMSQKNAEARYKELGQIKQINDQQRQLEAQQLTQLFQTEIDTLIVKVKDFVKSYGKSNSYTYILGTSDAAASVLYGSEENDLTQTILEALNTEYKKQ